MKTKTSIITAGILMLLSLNTYSQIYDTLCTPHPSKEAVALFRYIHDMFGEKTLSAQMWVPWSNDGFVYINSITGKQPAIMGIDFINESDNNTNVTTAKNYAKKGGIITAMWHQGAPSKGEGYEASKLTVGIDSCFIPGTAPYIAYWAALKTKADWLKKFKDANVPVLWRPYHELNGGWFWWSKQGPAKFKQLWDTMYNYFVNTRGLNNLIWVLCYSGTIDPTWNPGKNYVDIIGGDTYNVGNSTQIGMFNQLKSLAGTDTIPIAYHECGVPPDPDQCITDGAFWSWWMEWHTSYLFSVDSSYLNKVYNHDFIITLDELPKIDSIYGWDSVCIPTAIVPNFKIGSGSWQQSNKIGRYKNQDSIVTLSPVATGAGKWKWSGCGISDTSREQNFAITDFCTATVSYVNECGATSTKSFFVYNNCTSTAIAPHLQVDGGALQDTFRVTIDSGSFVTLIPEADTGGKWLWSGCKILIDSLQEQTISPASSCAPKVTYTNYCGKVSSKTFLIYVNRPSGISKKYINPGVSLFPDPCKEILNIQINQLPINSVSLVNVYSLQGSLLLTETVKSGNIKLNTSPLAPNIYIIKIVNNNFEITRKFVKVE